LHLVGILFPLINDDAWSKPHQICILKVCITFWARGNSHATRECGYEIRFRVNVWTVSVWDVSTGPNCCFTG